MDIDAFRYMQRGIQLFTLYEHDSSLLAAVEQRNGNMRHALLLLHGFSSSPAVFRCLLPSLSCYDAVICPILPGHSESIEVFAHTKAKDWLSLAEKSYKLLREEFDQVDVMGLSLGGLLACHVSSCFKLHHLYLLAPALDLRLSLNLHLNLIKALKWLGFNRIRSAAGNLFSRQNCEVAYRQLPLAIIIELFTLIQNYPFSAPTCPTDVFVGCHDEVISSKRVADRFADKNNINIHWLANSAHVIPLDADLETIVTCIKQNLSS